MNIHASYNWIKEYLKTDASAEQFAREMSLKSMAIEAMEDLKERYAHLVVGQIKEISNHPNADRLKVVIVDLGERTLEVVCGGQNLCSGMKVVVALSGAKVLWHGKGDWVELKDTEVRGVMSYGMICAPSELGFEKVDCKEGDIWDVTALTQAKPGTSFAEALDFDDTLFDIEVTSNRADSMSMIGLAREGGVAAQGSFVPPHIEPINEGVGRELTVSVEAPDLCPRYMAVVVDGVRVGASPFWMQKRLLLAGYRPINAIVDITNYILHEYGQPLHAFDYDTIEAKTLRIRRAKSGETMVALDGNTYQLSEHQLVIADASKPVAIAGIMGGELTGTTEKTKIVIFEAAAFDPVSVRRTSRALNLASDAQLIFEKGISVESPAAALARAVELTLELCGGEVASEIYDVRSEPYRPLVFSWNPDQTRKMIGLDLDEDHMKDILVRLGFTLEKTEDGYRVVVPYWRDHDIEDEADFTEEIARIFGYQNLPSVLPNQEPPRTKNDPELEWEERTKNVFASHGYVEFFGYSFVSSQDLERYDLDPQDAVALYNPLSSDLTHLRTSLIPCLLKDVEMNQAQEPDAKIFELSRVYRKQQGDLPQERTRLLFGQYGGKDAQRTFQEQKGMLMFWAGQVGIPLTLERVEDDVHWHPTRSATILFQGKSVGTIGQVAHEYQKAFGVERPLILVDVDFAALVGAMRLARTYEPIPQYPSIVRDLSFEVGEYCEYAQIEKAFEGVEPLLKTFTLKDIFKGAGVADGKKSLTISLTIRSEEKTLSSQEADMVVDKITRILIGQFEAKMR